MAKQPIWRNCDSIYKHLSHYYILWRSVVFIVDSWFDSVVYRYKVTKGIENLFKN